MHQMPLALTTPLAIEHCEVTDPERLLPRSSRFVVRLRHQKAAGRSGFPQWQPEICSAVSITNVPSRRASSDRVVLSLSFASSPSNDRTTIAPLPTFPGDPRPCPTCPSARPPNQAPIHRRPKENREPGVSRGLES